MIISLQALPCNRASQSLQVAVKKVGNSVGNSTIGGFGKDRVSGDLELLVITPTAASLKEFCMEHQHGQKKGRE